MIRHIAVIKLKPGCTPEQEQTFIDMVEDLVHHVDEIVSMSVGRSIGLDGSPTGAVALAADFANLADLNTYLTHPRHLAVSAYVAEIKETAMGADFEIERLEQA
ncbi:hypothetical protein Aple_028920 [Acrocarpospora pleiomorpha]|uniref:Stress-response A/B barrel domain-containing protein n=1 Tax=Acrocarpospora pleiomorpha TaxID=90975 RepID=A0A5M3XH47_9ACTN|nr:Dabb family protein [Acrocarpospora pleiomorpha]GES19996.1 hypothetical protein Aple_028920 [Acrocarpospora pleiomorpha]